MRFRLTQRASNQPPVGRILLLAASLFFCFITGVGSVTAQTTDDHGNSLSDATNLWLGSSIAGRIDPGNDRDVFKLDLSGESGNTRVWIYTTGNLDTLGGLYDSNGALIVADDDTTAGDRIVDTNFDIPGTLAPGVYYVEVFSADGTTTGDYTLHAKRDDHGNSFSTATTLPLGSPIAGRIDPGNDRDVFKLDLSGESGNTHVSIYTTSTLDTQGWLYDSNGDLLTSDDDITKGGEIVETNFRILWTMTPGVYYVSVRSADRRSTTTGDYNLYFQTRIDDHGNSFPTATRLQLGSSIAGRIEDPGDDWDVFKLDLSGRSGTTDVWIYTTGDLDTRGWLYDSSGDPYLVFNNNSYIVGRETSFAIRRNLPRGVYYISVQSWLTADGEYDATGDYTLHAEAVSGPGNSTGTATLLNLDSPTPGTVDTGSDADYFRVVLGEFKNLVIDAKGLVLRDPDGPVPVEPLDFAILDNRGAEVSVNVYPYTSGRDRWGFRIEDDFDTGTYYVKVTTPSGVTSHPVPYTIHAYEDIDHTNFIDDCEAATVSLNNPQVSDPLYGCQWHLNNRNGEDINVEPVWAEGINGEGVNIAVVDDGMYFSHEDLADNVEMTLNHSYHADSRDMQDIYGPYDHHGTKVAGVIAAQDNGIGVRGVAPKATVYGYNFLAPSGLERSVQDINGADAMARNRVVTGVSNNSWGPLGGPWLGEASQLWELAVDSGIREGYDGKGTFYVFAGGNGGRGHRENPDGTLVGGRVANVINRGDDSNLNELANYYAVTAVCAVNDEGARVVYSEKGANLWVCAPSKDATEDMGTATTDDDIEYRGIVTTENSNRYVDDFNGTSAAAPAVSGVGALLRQANPDLTWRDLKLILAASARKNDPVNSGWEEGARKYMVNNDTDRYHFNHEYGFGTVDAKAAVDMARGWTNVPTLESVSVVSQEAVTIPSPSDSGLQTVTTTLPLDTGIRFAEFVEINTDFDHASFRDMDIELVSPSGAVSKLAVPFNTRHYTDTYTRPDDTTYDGPYFVRLDGEFRFGSARHLGEDPNGVWTLRLTDHFPIYGGTLRSWSIKVYGHVSRPLDAPTITTPITAGADSLTVAWSASLDDGGSPVAAYDLRYIRTDADETVDTNWTVLEEVWAAGDGSLQYIITGLTGGTQYDVQMRGVSPVGSAVWSATAIGTTAPPVIPGAPRGLTAGVAVDEPRVDLSWTAPVSSGGAPITGYELESSDDGSDPWVKVFTTTGAATSYTDEGADANGPTFGVGVMRHYRVSAINSVGTGPPSNVAIATPDACRELLGLLTAPATRMGAWVDDCDSEGRTGGFARYYSFTLAESKQVEINLTSSVDSYLLLRQGEGREGAVVVENDNVGSRNFNSSINQVLVAGTYTIEATTYFAGQTGDFTLSVRPLLETEDLGPLTRSVDRSNSMWTSDYASTQQGRGHARSYTFTLTAATHVVINLTSPEDSYLYVLDTSGAVVHENDNVTTRNLNSRIDETFQPGTYTIEATTYFPARTGTFHLSIGYFGATGG